MAMKAQDVVVYYTCVRGINTIELEVSGSVKPGWAGTREIQGDGPEAVIETIKTDPSGLDVPMTTLTEVEIEDIEELMFERAEGLLAKVMEDNCE